MQGKGKRIKEEFGFACEVEAVEEYDALNRDFMYPNYPLIADEIISKLNFEQGNILDIGTGLGSLALEFAQRLPRAKIYGVDISEEMLDKARRFAKERAINNVEFICCDVHSLLFPDFSFELVVSFGVLHHVNDLRLAFSEIKRVLKEKGQAFIYDLKKDAAQDTVSEIAALMSPSHKKAFLESVKEAVDLSYLEKILASLDVSEYALSLPRYSRRTIVKNKDLLRKSKLLGERFNQIIIEGFVVK